MKVVLFSTDTKHHIHFINRLAPLCEIAAVFYETEHLVKDYPTGPFFADEEDRFEDRFFDPAFDGTAAELDPAAAAKVRTVGRVNDADVIAAVRGLAPDLGIAYGIGLAKPELFTVPRFGTINVHRGIAQDYRGLDSDLWAILEGRFDRIGVTIHYMDEGLDTGDILAQETVPLGPEDEIYHLRYKIGVVATRLVADLVARFAEAGAPLTGTPQAAAGPYYSAMSLDDKFRALERFRAHKKEPVA